MIPLPSLRPLASALPGRAMSAAASLSSAFLVTAAPAVVALAVLTASPAQAQQAAPITAAELSTFRSRSIGPAVTGGRITDVEVHPDHPSTLYVATASGGIWKSTNRGHQWTPIFDDQSASTFGDVAIAPSNPDVLYAGTGEQNNRQSTSWGDGVYRSDDGGATWRHLGLKGTRHVGRIVVHPTDPDVAWVAGLGNLWAANEERGVFRTRDGGRSWERVLYVDAVTGAVDLALDASDPDVLYAATYQRMRKAWGFNGGGPGSGIWKSTDGGTTWTELSNGLPRGDMGRIGLAVSRSHPDVVMALVEAPGKPTGDEPRGRGGFGRRDPGDTGTYRSEDGGATWTKMSDENGRPMYYSHIFIDPNDPNLVYSASTNSVKSTDGGRTWTSISAQPSYDVGVHLDMHAMWLDPSDRSHFYLAGDGGLHETYDGGKSYRKINNFVVAQFYGIGVDMREPYWVYGGLQDNHSWMGPSETRRYDGILNDDWQQIGFSDGMYQQVDKAGPRFVYSSATQGSYNRVDVIAGTKRPIGPVAPAGEDGYRFDWTSPGLASMHREGLFYMGGNRLFISRDFGLTWERTEDLGRDADLSARSLMGVPLDDVYISANDGVGGFGVITTLAESPLDLKVLWVGTDDGNVQVSRDQGKTWTEVSRNVRGVPDGTYVSRVEASAHDLGTAYATFDGHREGDFAPYVARTTDFGATWTRLDAGLPEGSVNVIVEHPDNAAVLFLGTENAPWVSTDGGAHWAMIPNLPRTAYDDMVLHPREQDLVMGTHGRGVWILDDTRFLGEWNGATHGAAAHLFPAGDGTLLRYRKDNSYRAQAEFAGDNPPDGVELTYRLGEGGGSGDATISVARADGTVIRRMRVPASAGVHRVNWNLRHGDPDAPDTWSRWDDPDYPRPPRADGGPMVSPGTYTVTLEARGATSSTTVRVKGDPLLERTDAQYRASEAFQLRAADLAERAEAALRQAGGPFNATGALGALAREILSFTRSFGDAGRFYDGNFDPPTAAELARIGELEARLRAATAGGGSRN